MIINGMKCAKSANKPRLTLKNPNRCVTPKNRITLVDPVQWLAQNRITLVASVQWLAKNRITLVVPEQCFSKNPNYLSALRESELTKNPNYPSKPVQ
jgi:hypothetical protein